MAVTSLSSQVEGSLQVSLKASRDAAQEMVSPITSLLRLYVPLWGHRGERGNSTLFELTLGLALYLLCGAFSISVHELECIRQPVSYKMDLMGKIPPDKVEV